MSQRSPFSSPSFATYEPCFTFLSCKTKIIKACLTELLKGFTDMMHGKHSNSILVEILPMSRCVSSNRSRVLKLQITMFLNWEPQKRR